MCFDEVKIGGNILLSFIFLIPVAQNENNILHVGFELKI